MGHITPVTALAFSPDGSLLASGSVQFSTTIMLWDVASGEARRTLVDHDKVGADHGVLSQYNRSVDDILKFTHISRIIVGGKYINGIV